MYHMWTNNDFHPDSKLTRYGRRLLQADTPTLTVSQPPFIVLISIIVFLVIAIIIAASILFYRHCVRRCRFHQRLSRLPTKNSSSTDEIRLTTSTTPSSTLSYSIQSTGERFTSPTVQNSFQMTQSISSTLPSVLPSRLFQKSMLDAYLNDFNFLQPSKIDPKQLNSYLFVDLHSTSSETYAEPPSMASSRENTTTSGYDTSTGAEEKISKTWGKYRRRRCLNPHRQRHRSVFAVRRSHAPRFLMRERSLPSHGIPLPQLRPQQQQERRHLNEKSFCQNSTSTMTDTDPSSNSFSSSNIDQTSHRSVANPRLKTIEEEIISPHLTNPTKQTYFFEKVSTSRGDESDMAVYEDLPVKWQTPSVLPKSIAYVNDSILV